MLPLGCVEAHRVVDYPRNERALTGLTRARPARKSPARGGASGDEHAERTPRQPRDEAWKVGAVPLFLDIWCVSLGDKGQNKAPPETVGASAHLNGEHGRSGVEAEAA